MQKNLCTWRYFPPPALLNLLQNNTHIMKAQEILTYHQADSFSFESRSYKVQQGKEISRNSNCPCSFFSPLSNPTPLSRPGSNAVPCGRSFLKLVPVSPTLFSGLSPLPESLSQMDLALYDCCLHVWYFSFS